MTQAIAQQVITELPSSLRCEIAVIGSGPGGAITACYLAESGRDVLLIEEGDFLAINSCEPFSRTEMIQKYRNGGITAAMGKPKVQYVEGRCVGGGSEINSGLYHRTPSQILETWQREFQVQSLTEADLLPHFEACEKDVTVSYLPSQAPPASLKLHEGATKLGWRSLEIPRWFKYEDSSGEKSTNKGNRQSMTETFIPRALQAGCRLLPNTKVNLLKSDGDRWILKAESHSLNLSQVQSLEISAEYVFVCGGAIQTPALLRRSGIKRNIGNSLQMHPTVKAIAKFPKTINFADMGVPVHQVKEFAPAFSFGCAISSPEYLALAMYDHPDQAKLVDRDWTQMAIYYAMISSEGFGSVRCLPGFRDPLVRYHLTHNDLKQLATALSALTKLLFTAGATAIYPSLSNSSPLTQIADIERLPKQLPRDRTNLMTVHLFSSCPMGEDLTKCATDSFGRVHGYKNLYITDASLLCTAPGVNPQGTIMAIARRNVLKFLGKL